MRLIVARSDEAAGRLRTKATPPEKKCKECGEPFEGYGETCPKCAKGKEQERSLQALDTKLAEIEAAEAGCKFHPSAGEAQSDFMHRCVPGMVEEGRDQDVAVAACLNMFRRGPKSAEVPGQKRLGDSVVAKRFEVEAPLDGKKVTGYRTVRDEATQEITDYRGVTIEGYLSTWQETTPKDRDGEYVVKGAFGKSLDSFMRNPVMLRDHRNHTDSVAGRFLELREDDRGLWFKARLADTDAMRDTRRNVVEKNLSTVSMGGAFLYDKDRKGIKEVTLFEGTLTPVPANPDALFRVSDVSAEGKAWLDGGGELQGLKRFELAAPREKVVDTAGQT